MDIYIDIDGTLAPNNREMVSCVANQRWGLGIDKNQLKGITLDQWENLPEVVAYKSRMAPERYQLELGWLNFHPDVLLSLIPYKGAVEALDELLAQGHRITYATARYSPYSSEKSQAMATATKQWLKQEGFPNPQQAIFMDGLPGKLKMIAERIKQNPGPAVLIDDQHKRLIEQANLLEKDQQDILSRYLTLMCYGATELPDTALLKMLSLRAWRDRDGLVEGLASTEARKEVHI